MYRFIQNTGDFFAPGYYTEDFASKVIALSGYDSDAIKEFNSRFPRLKTEYFDFKSKVKDSRLHSKYIIKETHDFNTKLMEKLGYDTSPAYADWIYIDDNSVIPARSILRNGSQTRLVILEMQAMVKAHDDDVPAGLFEQQYDDTGNKVKEQKYLYSQWAGVISRELPEGCSINPSKINECVTAIFGLPMEQRPQYIVIFAGNMVFVVEQDKWDHGAYLVFDLEELFSEASISANRNYYALFYLLASKEVLAGDAQIVLMDRIAEEAYKNTYEVTKDLKNGVIKAVELLANEAIYYKREVLKESFDETSEFFAGAVKDDCLTIIYRLLFIFYAEARPEIGILPMDDQAYAKGYSLDVLRDLEQTPLRSQQSQNSYFFHDSLWTLFELIRDGHNDSSSSTHVSFSVKKIDSPLFNDQSLTQLKGVKFRNKIWQEIICSLSLSEEKSRKSRGRISYANLGINQLGSVYESLLAYRGFYAKEDYIEVHPKDKEDETYLVQRSRMADFKEEEILRDRNGNMEILPKGQFVYRLNGRDRKKSASYYTPEVLTKSTVKYTLKGFVEKLDNGEMKAEDLLKLKILEPAMGAAAFQNEVINQVAELYLMYRQRERGIRISPHLYQDELKKVKAYIATKNIYGVDLNPTAIELGKLSLWLNVIHKDMETPFFGHRIALGNAVIGAWFKAYNEIELCKIERSKYVSTEWWDKAPHLLHFSKDTKKLKRKPGEIYHFLVPDKNMLGVLSIKEEKNAHPDAAAQMKKILKDWTEPITKENIQVLKKLSAKIDSLIRECVIHQQKVDSVTQNKYSIWGHTDRTYESYNFDAFDDKQSISDSRNLKGNAFFKLRTVMDYWCSLWFWEYDDAKLLPTRTEYWQDIAEILGINLSGNDNSHAQTTRFEEANLFNQPTEEDFAVPEADEERIEEDIPTYTREDAEAELRKVRTETKLFENGYRIPVVQRLAERYRFFHPMLEFIEVFWLRDGFDIICGNPPWIKWLFEPQAVLSDTYPELMIRPDEYDADYVGKHINQYLTSDAIRSVYHAEQTENACCQVMLNSASLYNPLKGSQTDLFKCILYNSLEILSPSGYLGLIHPDTVYTEAKGQTLRKYIYPRLVARFHYTNRLELFSGVEGKKPFDCCIYRGQDTTIHFDTINNLCIPNTIDASYADYGKEPCLGFEYVDEEGKKHVNTKGNRDRIIRYDESLMQMMAQIFENTDEWRSCKMELVYTMSSLDIVRRFSQFEHLSSIYPIITEGYHATNAKKDGTMIAKTKYPDYDGYEMIFNSTQVGILSPFSKMPQEVCTRDANYDIVDYLKLGIGDDIRTNYVPLTDIVTFKKRLGESEGWFSRYKIGFKKMMDTTHERTLKGGILPPKSSHTNSIISASFSDNEDLVLFAGLTSSIMFDFFIKTVGIKNLTNSVMLGLPFYKDERFRDAIAVRVLRLNCVNHWYEELWKKMFSESFKKQTWSKDDKRLSDFSILESKYNGNVLLRNEYERRQAMVELDVLVTMMMGFPLSELESAYISTFPTNQKYDSDTWYDSNGRVIFSVSGEYDVKLPRKSNVAPAWESIRGSLSEDGMTYVGTSPTLEHTIDPAKSELYGGQKVTYYAPYNRCDRIADYRTAWAHFEKIFNDKS